MLTDKEIQKKFRECSKDQPRREIAEKSERGGGRLLLLVRWNENKSDSRRTGAVAEWYAKYYRNGKRRLTKIGSYPKMPLAEPSNTKRGNALYSLLQRGSVEI